VHNYIAGVLVLVALCGVAVFGLEAYRIYDADRMVQAALLDGQSRLAADGGVSPGVQRLVRRRIEADGGDVTRVRISGSPQGTASGREVTLTVAYDLPFTLAALLPGREGRDGVFHIRHSATTLSGYGS